MSIKNPQFHGPSKHIAIKYHFIRDQVKGGTIEVQYCRTEEMVADVFTKELYSETFAKLGSMIGVEAQVRARSPSVRRSVGE